MTLEEFMQQQATQRGYTKSPLRYVSENLEGGPDEEIDQNRVDFQAMLPYFKRIDPVYGEMVDTQVGEADAPSYEKRFASREEELKNAYYADPSNFIETRATPIATGVNTFNEGNEDQKRIVDQINTGQLVIVPVTYTSEFLNSDAGAVQKQTHSGYELKDARTGQKIQDVTPIDAEKGIFNIVADDRNSSGFFNNYVSTDPSGFVNPVVSEQQSQYQSKPNSSANFIRSSLMGVLQMGAMVATGGASTAIGNAILGAGATGAATLGSAIVGAGMNVLTSVASGRDITAGGVLTGAATGAISANAMDIAANIVGGGDAIAGVATLSNIASEMGIKVADVGKIVSGAVATGVAAGVNGNDVAEAITKNLVSSGLGAYAGGLVDGIDPGKMDTAVKVATNVAKVGATAAMNGTDITTALQNSLPSILTNSLTGGRNATTNATETKVAEDTTIDDSGVKTASTIEVGDTSEFDPGTKITLADGSTGVVSGNGTIVPEGTVPETTTVGLPTGVASTPGGTELKQIGVDEYGMPKYEMTVSAKTEDDRTNEERMVNPDGTESDAKQYRELLEEGFSDEEARERSAYPSNGKTSTGETDFLPSDYVPNPDDVKNTVKNADGTTSYVMKDGTVITDGQIQDPGTPIINKDVTSEIKTPPGEPIEIWTGANYDTVYKQPNGTYRDVQGNEVGSGGEVSEVGRPGPTGGLTDTDIILPPSGGGGLPITAEATNPSVGGGGLSTIATTPGNGPGMDNTVGGGTGTGGTGTGGGGGGTGTGGGGGGTTTTATLPKVTLPAVTTAATTTAAPASTKSAFQPAADATGGIPNLTPGLTKAMNDYQLTGLNAIDTTPDMKSGGSTSAIDDLNAGKDYNPMETSLMAYLKPGLTRANLQYALTGMPTMRKADGGEIMQEDLSMPEGHHPQFFSEGGLQNRYVRGDGDGTSDDVPAMLANGEFVIPADVVASLGNGDNDSGAKVLDEFLAVIRKHKRAADAKHLPPDSKGALGYLAEAHSKVRA